MGWLRALSKDLFNYVNQPRKKWMSKLINFILVFMIPQLDHPHNNGVALPPRSPPVEPSLLSPFDSPACFLLVVVLIPCLAATEGHDVFYFPIFLSPKAISYGSLFSLLLLLLLEISSSGHLCHWSVLMASPPFFRGRLNVHCVGLYYSNWTRF
jgi:hypothetical protein